MRFRRTPKGISGMADSVADDEGALRREATSVCAQLREGCSQEEALDDAGHTTENPKP